MPTLGGFEYIQARAMMNNGDVETLVGSQIAKSYPDMSSVWKVAELAMKCVEKRPKYRPCMSDVVRELREATAIESAHASYKGKDYSMARPQVR